MIISSCPLRISLFGGSTDNPYFIEKYGFGSVISFTCNLKTYTTLYKDKVGYNSTFKKFSINYSKKETTDSIDKIQNELVRTVLNHFNLEPLTVTLTSDIYSQGSGLASSSSYIINLIKCISIYKNINLTDIEICKLAFKLEQEFNPYCGYQDPYGCGIGGFKKINFEKGEVINYSFLCTEIFKEYDMHLSYTGVSRNSKNVLKDVSNNIDKVYPLLETVEKANEFLKQKEYEQFLNLINYGWEQKKSTSNIIMENETIRTMDGVFCKNDTVMSHKLCGAGNGGFFLLFSKKGSLNVPYDTVKINVIPAGVIGKTL